MEENEQRVTLSFYHYFSVEDPKAFRDQLYLHLNALKVYGRIYVAKEGINAQVSVPASQFESFKTFLYSIEPLNGLRLNIAVDDGARLNDPVGQARLNDPVGQARLNDSVGQGKSFWVLRIKVRDKIVADGIRDPSFNMFQKGKYVNALKMNELMKDPGTVVIDMRNHYEYEVGHFENAVEIPSDTFREQLPMAADMMKGKEDNNIIMYCTGGIRCEKASAYMLHKGFKNVFHLEGGIINYAREIKENEAPSKFIGKNFVFDERLGERITEDVIAKCHQCGKSCDTHTNCKNHGCHLLFIQCEDCAKQYDGCCSIECKNTIAMPLERQKAIRSGIDKGQNIFSKSKRLRPKLGETKE